MRIRTLINAVFICSLLFLVSCAKKLDEFNENPNGINPATANPNLILPTVLSGAANNYLGLGYGKIGGAMQHMQEDGWHSGYNSYDWSEEDWSNWYGVLRNNEFLYNRATEMDYPLHQGIAQTMRAFVFGTIADLWGDAPYTEALRGATDISYPAYDTQETIYKGIIEELKVAVNTLNSVGDVSGYYAPGYDLYYNGDAAKWKKFANSLLLRYAMRLSEKLPDLAKSTLEQVYNSGDYIKSSGEDATMGFSALPASQANNAWPGNKDKGGNDPESEWRRRKPCSTLLDRLTQYGDPRREVWFQPVHCRWVADPALATAVDPFIRKNGVLTDLVSMTDIAYREAGSSDIYTRRYNPNLFTANPPFTFAAPNTNEYVGVPPALLYPDYFNNNPTPGQSVENQHVSQLSTVFLQANDGANGILKARLSTASEVAFILAEAAQRGWAAGDAQANYNNGIKFSLESWGVGDKYNDYADNAGVAYDGTLKQILEQKWIAGFANALESWFDWRRTGLPVMAAPGNGSVQPVIPVRLIYGNNEINVNAANASAAIDRLSTTPYSTLRGKNSQWAKPWIIEGTGKPW